MLFSFLNAKKKSLIKRRDKLSGVRAVMEFLRKEWLYPDFHAIESGVNEAECVVNGEKYLMFASNNYLGLSENKNVKEAAKKAIDRYGTGPGGSRVISGDVDIIRQLEKEIADLTGFEDCLTFPTGYMANVAVFQALMDPLFFGMPAKSSDSIIFSDQYNHGSIIDGARLSKAKKVVFKHDDINDLRKKLEENDLPNKLIVTEGVFSLDGEIIDLPKYVDIAREFNAKLMIDDAHGVGVIGENGGGAPEYHGVQGEIDVLMGSLDKAFGGTGGYLCGTKEMIDYLRIACRSSILSSAIPASVAGAMIQSAKEIRLASDKREQIVRNAKYLTDKLRELGFKVYYRDPIPVLALFAGKESVGIKFANMLWDKKIFSPVVRWPAVPEGESRFRVLMMTSHTKEHLDILINACEEIGKKLKLI